MELSIKQMVIGAVSILAVGLLAGRYSSSGKTVVTEIKTAERESTKKIEVKHNEKNQDIVIIETKLPDGTIKKETHIVTKNESNTDIKTDKTSDKTTDSKTTIASSKLDWHVSLLASMSHNSDNFIPGAFSYGLSIERRIIGPFSIGAFGLSNQTYGISAGASF